MNDNINETIAHIKGLNDKDFKYINNFVTSEYLKRLRERGV